MRLPCDSTNVRERPWASKPQPINYKRCCTDRLNSHPESGSANSALMSTRPRRAVEVAARLKFSFDALRDRAKVIAAVAAALRSECAYGPALLAAVEH